ncbi:MAG: DUF1877 family protein [Moraxellaceae bacterium]|nr:DUF1877 family protein [Pseudomonadales bacterium]MCP5174912.1 DUF1877 family protein [Moraxellaceae bacterium]MCP5176199.1 DUF1877 family protein [Moraxellaceae bacterium]
MMAMVWTAISPQDCELIENADGEEVEITEDSPEIDLMDTWSEVLCLLSHDIFQWNAPNEFAALSLLSESSVLDVEIGNLYTAFDFSYHSPLWVQDIAKAFESFSDNEFIARAKSKYYQTQKMKDDNYRHGHDVEELLAFYNDLKNFYINAAQNGNGMIFRTI